MRNCVLRIVAYLHEKDVLVAVESQHVIVYLGHDAVPVLPVQEPKLGNSKLRSRLKQNLLL